MSPNSSDLPPYDSNPTQIVKTDELGVTPQEDVSTTNVKVGNKSIDFSKDLLPSFEMHNFMLNRTLNDDISPDYQESITGTAVSSQTPNESLPSLQTTLNSGDLVLENLHKLQKINLPFEVKVTFTEDVPAVGVPYKKVSALKQYYPGDMIYGFVTFENKTKYNLPFEMLLVSLECEIGVQNPKTKGQVRKRIIAMYDLEASYNFIGTDTYCNVCHMKDPFDNTYIGFKSRLMEPGVVVKKFFRFKVPTFLLDDNCCEQFPEHLKIPPSFGLNRYSCKSAASHIKIDPHLGYGKLDKLGSPIQVQDYALPNEFCQYFINVQLIGRRLDVYKQFYTPNTVHQYDFIFLKNVEYHFRVRKRPQSDEGDLYYGSTKDQLDAIEKIAKEAIEVLTERDMLAKVNITDLSEQDEIIFSSTGKIKTSSDTLVYQPQEKQPLDSSFHTKMQVIFKKDIFSKLSGKLDIIGKIASGSTLQSFLPKLLEEKQLSLLCNLEFMKATTSMLTLDLIYQPLDNTDRFPSSIFVKPSIIAVDLQSAANIPFTMDNRFILQDADDIKKCFQRFLLYYTKIGELMMKKTSNGVPKSTYELLRGMAYLRYNEIRIPNIFKAYNFELSQSQWKHDPVSKVFKTTVTIPLEYDVNHILLNPKALISSFQTCKFGRLYKIQVDISLQKGKKCNSVYPITVI